MLKVEQLYPSGMPQTAVPGFAPPGVGWHWTAGAAGRTGWNGTVAHLINTRLTINASYHGGLFPEHKAGHVGCVTVIQWVVPTTKAAHSVHPPSCWQYNASKPRAVQDARFTEVRRILGAKAGDPNAGMLAIAYAGMPADLERDLQCPVFRADVQNLARQLVAHPATVDRPHFGHGWIQPISRYEMDVASDFIGLLYAASGALPAPNPIQETDMQFWRPVQQDWHTADGTVFFDGAGARKVFTSRDRVRSVAESSDGRYRLLRYGTEHLVCDARGALKEGPGLIYISGTRIPATGFGFPPAETVEVIKTVEKIVEKIVEVPDPEAAAAAVEAEQARIAAVLGIG